MSEKPAFVYVIGPPSGGPLKIGIAGDPAKRLRQLQHASAVPLVAFHLCKFSKRSIAAQVEARAHAILAADRMSGEWFACSTEQAEAAIGAASVWVKNRRVNVAAGPLRSAVHLRIVR